MKHLGKLIINPEKVIKNEELVNLRGGTYDSDCRDQGLLAFQCKCTPPDVGLWRGCYADQAAADASISERCANTGKCDELSSI